MRLAIIDMGSNTFHLLIADMNPDGTAQMLYKEREFVHLADQGLGELSADSLLRAEIALKFFREKIKEYAVQYTELVGTAAIRSASNSDKLEKIIENIFHQSSTIITGENEAKFIYNGVLMAADGNLGDALIMDIGGGSVEFIIVQDGKPVWLQSYPIGISVLKSQNHYSDPFSIGELEDLDNYISEFLKDVTEEVKKRNINTLIGSSGTFEVFSDNLNHQEITENMWELSVQEVIAFMEEILVLNLEERKNHPGIPEWRAALMPWAIGLIRWTIQHLSPNHFYYSNYALKEGRLNSLYESVVVDKS